MSRCLWCDLPLSRREYRDGLQYHARCFELAKAAVSALRTDDSPQPWPQQPRAVTDRRPADRTGCAFILGAATMLTLGLVAIFTLTIIRTLF